MCIKPIWLVPKIINGEYTYRFDKKFDGDISSWSILDPSSGQLYEPFQVGCGKCLECIENHKRQWVFRLNLEASQHSKKCFVTLTYSNAPKTGVEKQDIQAFIKSLRNHYRGSKIRYYACGEYGSQGRRPHYHLCLFGVDFEDKKPFRRDKKGFLMYRSKLLEELWPFGFSSILPINSTTLGYCTKDMQKLLPLEDGRNKPFVLMSLKPGIGADGWDRRLTDGKIYINGQSCFLPRYFVKLAKRENLDLTSYYKNIASIPNRPLTEDRIDRVKEREKRLKNYQIKS